MNMEQFTLLVDLMRDAGEGGYVLALLYLGVDYLNSICTTGVLLAVVVLASRLAHRAMKLSDFQATVGKIIDENLDYTTRRSEFLKWLKRQDYSS